MKLIQNSVVKELKSDMNLNGSMKLPRHFPYIKMVKKQVKRGLFVFMIMLMLQENLRVTGERVLMLKSKNKRLL